VILQRRVFRAKGQKNYKEKKSLKLLRIDNKKPKLKEQIKKLWLSHHQWRLGPNATYFALLTRSVSHYGLAIWIKKHLRAKEEELWKLKYFTMQKYNLQKVLQKKPKSFKILELYYN
jgi:hypothetical protein